MKCELEVKLEKMAKKAAKGLALVLLLAMLLYDYCCITRTLNYTSCGWGFWKAANKAADEIGADISTAWNWTVRKLGFGPAWTESWPIPNANVNWNTMGRGE